MRRKKWNCIAIRIPRQAGYYSRLEENLKFLQQNGVTIVPLDQLEAVVLGENVPEETEAAPKKEESTGEKEQPVSGSTLRLEKRIITERDVISAREGKAALHSGRKEGNSGQILPKSMRRNMESALHRDEGETGGKGSRV